MKLIKDKNEFGHIIILEDNNIFLSFTFGGNGDLYWSIHSKNDSNQKKFTITKENYSLYELFEKLFDDIEQINIFETNDITPYTETEEEKKEYRLNNCSNYNELYDKNNKTITWYSDETAHKVANVLKIKKEEDMFIIEFFIQKYINGYDEDFHSEKYIPIRFRNSGSSYYPFNIVFMRMYNKMKKLTDINDMNHQIHIEEYLYSNRKLIKKYNKKF